MATSLPEFMLELASKQGKNIKQQIDNAYAPMDYQAKIDLNQGKLAEIPQKIKLAMAAEQLKRAQANRIPLLMMLDRLKSSQMQRDLSEPDYKSNYGKAFRDAELMRQKYGENSPQYLGAKKNLDRIAAGSQMTVYDPVTGDPIVQMGGGGAGGRGKGPGVNVNQKTGELRSPLTNANAARVQKSIIGNTVVQSNINNIIKDIMPYLGAKGMLNLGFDMMRNPFQKGSNDALAKYDSAMKTLDVRAEELMASAGLNSTIPALRLMQNVMKPAKYMNAETWRAAVLNTLVNLKMQEEIQKDMLARGAPVGNVNQPYQAPADDDSGDADVVWDDAEGDLEE